MKMIKTPLFAAAAAACLFFVPHEAKADLLDEIKERGVFNVGTESRFPPFEFIEDGKIVGYSQDIMVEIMKGLPGVELERLDLPWQGILPGLDASQFDYVVTSVTVTGERYDRYAMSRPIADGTMAIMTKTAADDITTPADIAGHTVGTQAGTVHFEKLQEFAATLDKPVKITTYVDYNEAYADLAAGRIDAVANSLPNLLDAQKTRPELFAVAEGTFGPKSFFSWVARKDADSASLTEFMDASLERLQKDGTLAELQTKWFGAPMDLPEGPLERPDF
jgi:polar amino acid transport system substrate-binding protein